MQAWLLLEVASSPAVEERASEPQAADCAAPAGRLAEGFADALAGRAQPVSAAVDCCAAPAQGDYLAEPPEGDSQDDSSPVDSVVAGSANPELDGSVLDAPLVDPVLVAQAGLVAAGSAALSPADYWEDSLPDDSVEQVQAESAGWSAGSVVRAQLRRDARSPPGDYPADYLVDSQLAPVVPDGPCLAERPVCLQPALLVSPAARPLQLDVPLQPPLDAAFVLLYVPAVVRDAPPELVVVSQKPPAGVEVFSWPRPAGSQSLPEARLHVPQSMPSRLEQLRGSELPRPVHPPVRRPCRAHLQ